MKTRSRLRSRLGVARFRDRPQRRSARRMSGALTRAVRCISETTSTRTRMTRRRREATARHRDGGSLCRRDPSGDDQDTEGVAFVDDLPLGRVRVVEDRVEDHRIQEHRAGRTWRTQDVLLAPFDALKDAEEIPAVSVDAQTSNGRDPHACSMSRVAGFERTSDADMTATGAMWRRPVSCSSASGRSEDA